METMKHSEKWNEDGEVKSLTTRIQEMCQDDFSLEKTASKFSLEHLLTPKLNRY